MKLVAKVRVPCWPWRLRVPANAHPVGAVCADCGRDVALERDDAGKVAVCLYCAIDTGLLPAEEIPPECDAIGNFSFSLRSAV